MVKFLSPFQTSIPHIESGQHAWYYCYSSKLTYPPQMWKPIIYCGEHWFLNGIFFLHGSSSVSTLGPTRGRSVGILTYQSMSALIHLGKSDISGSLSTECLQPSLEISGELCISSSFISSPHSKFLTEYVTGHLRLPILATSYWMEDSWLPAAVNMLEAIPH